MKSERLKIIQKYSEERLPVFYYCFRDFRINDNWGLFTASTYALKNKQSLTIIYILPMQITRRKYDFLMHAIDECILLAGSYNFQVQLITEEVFKKRKHPLAHHIFDFHPIITKRLLLKNKTDLLSPCTGNISIPGSIYCVDSHNLIPCWYVSDKQEYSAKCFRAKAIKIWESFIEPFPKLLALKTCLKTPPFIDLQGLMIDESVGPLKIKGGYSMGMARYRKFLTILKDYPRTRSHMSAYINHGMVSAQECIRLLPPLPLFSSFLDQIFIRRELCDNFCYYGNIDNLSTVSIWIRNNIEKHRTDIRSPILSIQELESCKSPDPIWNKIQSELITEGYLLGPMRIYWAKKIPFWTKNIEDALFYTLYLNDKYHLDGNDPAGIVGVLWSIIGLHDKPTLEREVLGRVRIVKRDPYQKK